MPKRLPPLPDPRLIEMRYSKRLRTIVDRIEADFWRGESIQYREDAKSSKSKARNKVKKLRKKYRLQPKKETLEKTFQDVNRHNRREFNKVYKDALGIQPPASFAALQKQFVSENVRLIKSLPTELLNEVEDIMIDALTKGTRNEVVASRIAERFDVGRSRARLIARDQIGKAMGQINAARQQKAGVKRFRWSTSKDERVRSTHRAIGGKVYSYPSGHPVEGIPGQPIQCRCSAIPVIEGFV